ncbi:MAG: glycosyltransferase [Myxococcales bacterium]|nr:MAG: glycosyltransferase [Myxococcales bacterium]
MMTAASNHSSADAQSKASAVGQWLRGRIPFLNPDRSLVRVLMYPAAEQNPFLVVTRRKLEELGAKVTMLTAFDAATLARLAPTHDVLHLFNIQEYKSAFTSPEMVKQVRQLGRRLSALVTAKGLGLRIVWTLYNEPKGDYSSEWLERLGRQWIFSLADRIICPSQATSTLLRTRYPGMPDHKLTVIPHHNFGQYFPKQVSRRQARTHLGIETQGRVFLCFGGIHPYKGLTDLIPLFGRHPLREHTLIVAGNPSNVHYAATIEGLCSQYPNVHAYLRYVPADDVQYYMHAADVFVMPFKDVLNSGSLMLALSFGKPLVAPAVGSIPEIATSACSVLYDPAAANGLKTALAQAAEMDIERAAGAARRVADGYSADKLTRRLVNLYLEFFPKRPKLPEEDEEL